MSTPAASPGSLTMAVGDATKVHDCHLVHIVSDLPAWGSGFVNAITAAFGHDPRNAHIRRRTYVLGEVDFVEVKDGVVVCNMIAQHGLRSRLNPRPVDYKALRDALTKVTEHIKGSKGWKEGRGSPVHMPLIGCDRGGGRWEDVRPIIEETLVSAGLHVTVWTLPQ